MSVPRPPILGLEASAAGRPDNRFEVLVRCRLAEVEAPDVCFLSAGSVFGLGSGDILSGSAIRTAVWYVSFLALASVQKDDACRCGSND